MNDDIADAGRLFELVKAGDHSGVTAAVEAGAKLQPRDSDDWSCLDWAAGKGDATMVQILLDHGADPCSMGRELRTPYQIALAAGHLDAARLLRAAEEAADPSSAERHVWRPYCKAYQLAELRRFPEWTEPVAETCGDATAAAESWSVGDGAQTDVAEADGAQGDDAQDDDGELTDETVVFIHDDLTVTRSMWPGEDVVFAAVTPAWTAFCRDVLGFRVPDDFDLVPDAPPVST